MNLTAEFWDTQKGLLLIGSDGSLRFTAAGKLRYAPLLAKYGFALQNISSAERFSQVMESVNAGELEENTQTFETLLCDPKTTAEEKALICRVLGRPEPLRPVRLESCDTAPKKKTPREGASE
jgi:hypothetical protein